MNLQKAAWKRALTTLLKCQRNWSSHLTNEVMLLSVQNAWQIFLYNIQLLPYTIQLFPLPVVLYYNSARDNSVFVMIIIKAVGGCWYWRWGMWSRDFLQLSGDREEPFSRARRPRERSESGTRRHTPLVTIAESAVCINTSQRFDLHVVVVCNSLPCTLRWLQSVFTYTGYFPYILSRVLTYSPACLFYILRRELCSAPEDDVWPGAAM